MLRHLPPGDRGPVVTAGRLPPTRPRPISTGAIALVAAPVAAVAASLLLAAITAQLLPTLAWGGVITLAAAAPLAVPERYRRVAIWTCAAAVLAVIVLGILSIGAYFLPVPAALVIAGRTHRPRTR